MPDGGCDLLWTGTSLVVAGPDRRARFVQHDPHAHACGVRFLPGAARQALGMPGAALVDATLPAAAVLGERSAGELAERLATAPADARPRLLASWASSRARAVDHRDPAVAFVAAALARDPSLRIAALAERIGYSERQLRRRVTAEVGYAPKLLARILRLRRAVAEAGRDPTLSLADTALACGYVDQAHLGHDAAALAGTTAAELLGR
ncbi:MAG: helix-turn-helix domain-containing protein [Patulibacter minatonensis]